MADDGLPFTTIIGVGAIGLGAYTLYRYFEDEQIATAREAAAQLEVWMTDETDGVADQSDLLMHRAQSENMARAWYPELSSAGKDAVGQDPESFYDDLESSNLTLEEESWASKNYAASILRRYEVERTDDDDFFSSWIELSLLGFSAAVILRVVAPSVVKVVQEIRNQPDGESARQMLATDPVGAWVPENELPEPIASPPPEGPTDPSPPGSPQPVGDVQTDTLSDNVTSYVWDTIISWVAIGGAVGFTIYDNAPAVIAAVTEWSQEDVHNQPLWVWALVLLSILVVAAIYVAVPPGVDYGVSSAYLGAVGLIIGVSFINPADLIDFEDAAREAFETF